MKEIYDHTAAEEMARRHARHFVERCIAELQSVQADDWNRIVIAPFDAELFGHWWFEGPIFLEQVILAAAENQLLLTTPSEFLMQNPTQQLSEPATSSWGDQGFLDVWLDQKCAWIYPHLFTANTRMTTLAKSRGRKTTADDERAASAGTRASSCAIQRLGLPHSQRHCEKLRHQTSAADHLYGSQSLRTSLSAERSIAIFFSTM